jgi:Glycosyl transferases group 1
MESRARLCENIRARIPDLKFDVRGLFGHPNAYGARVFDVLGNAKMGVNFSRRDDVYLYSSDRMAQLMGLGLLTFLDRRTGFGGMIGEDAAAFYEGQDELVEKLLHFRNNDQARREVARRGWLRAHDIFNATKAARWIEEATFRLAKSQDYAWPTEIHEN